MIATSDETRSVPAAAPAAASTLFLAPFGVDRVAEGRRRAADLVGGPDVHRSLAHRGVHPDVIELTPPEKRERIGIDQVREVIRQAQFAPVQGERKVCVVPRAEALTPEASNALLKVMEEPPRDLTFVLIAEHPSELLPTIVSRSRLVRLLPPDTSAFRRRLEAAGYPDDQIRWLARIAPPEVDASRFAEMLRDLAAERRAAVAALADATAPDLVDAALGEDPIRQREALVAMLDGMVERTPELLTVGVRTIAAQARDDVVRLLQRLLAVCFDAIRSFERDPHPLDASMIAVRDRIGEPSLRALCDAIDDAHRAVAVYSPIEAVLLSLFLVPTAGGAHAR